MGNGIRGFRSRSVVVHSGRTGPRRRHQEAPVPRAVPRPNRGPEVDLHTVCGHQVNGANSPHRRPTDGHDPQDVHRRVQAPGGAHGDRPAPRRGRGRSRHGVPAGRLHDWLNAFSVRGADAFPRPRSPRPHDDEPHRLPAEVQRLEAERDDQKSRLRPPLDDAKPFLTMPAHSTEGSTIWQHPRSRHSLGTPASTISFSTPSHSE